MTQKIHKKETKIAHIVGVFKGGSELNESEVTTKFQVIGELTNKQLKRLLKIGDINIKRSGAGMRVVIKWYLN